MLLDELQKELDKIDPKLFINFDVNDEFESVNYSGHWDDFILYDAKNHVFNDEACEELLENKRHIFKKLINKFRNNPYKSQRKDNQMTRDDVRLDNLKAEKAEVDTKLLNLDQFLFEHCHGIDYEEKRLVRVQRTIMYSYSNILGQRIRVIEGDN